MILLMKSEYGLETSWTGSISVWTHQIIAPLIGTRIYQGWELEKLVYRWIVQAGLPVHSYTACMDHLQWVWLWHVTVVMLVYTNVLWWLREVFFTSLCMSADSYSDVACILWLYMCVGCKYANIIEIATCVHAQWCEKCFLSIHLCTPTWWPQHRTYLEI